MLLQKHGGVHDLTDHQYRAVARRKKSMRARRFHSEFFIKAVVGLK
jgi:hypothetical protein